MARVLRRIARVLAWIALSALLVVLLAATTLILWARSASGRRVLLSTVVSTVQKRLSGRLTIGALEGDLTRSIVLRQVRLYDGERKVAVAIEAIRIEYDLVGLVSRQVRVRSLGVEGGRIDGRWLRDGRLNLTALGKAQPSAEARTAAEAGSQPGEPSRGERGWTIAVGAVAVDAQLVVDARSQWPAVRGTLEVAGGLGGSLAAPAFADLRVRFRSNGRVAGPLEASLRVDGPHDDLAAELLVHAADGELAARGKAALDADGTPTWRARVESRDLDPAALLAGAPHGRIEVTADARGHGRSGSIVVERLTLDAAGTRASAYGVVELGAVPTADVGVELRSPDLSRLRGSGLPELHGSVEGHGHARLTSSHLEVDAAMTGRSVRVGSTHLHALDAHVHADETRLALTIDAAGPRGNLVTLRAHGAPLRHDGRWGLDVVVDRLAVGSAATGWHATAPGRVRIDRQAAHATLALAANDGDDDDARRQTLTLDGSIERSAGEGEGEGEGALAADLRAHDVKLETLRPLLPPALRSLSGRASLTAHLSGTTGAPVLDAHLAVPAWTLGTLPSSRLSAEMHYRGAQLDAHWEAGFGEHDGAGVLDGEAALPVDVTAGAGALVERLSPTRPLSLRVRGRALDLAQLSSESLRARDRIHAGVVDLTLDVHGPLRATEAALHATAHGVHVADVDKIDLVVDGAYRRGHARATVSGSIHDVPVLVAQAESTVDLQRLADGAPWRALPLAAELTIPSFDLARVGALAGVVEGAAQVRGTLGHPTAEAELHGRDLRLSELELTRLDARAGWDGGVLVVHLDGAQPPGGTLQLDATVPAAADAPMHAALKAHAFSFALDDVGSVRRLEGTLEAELRVDGPRAHPTLAGSLQLDHGAFAGGSDPRLFRDLTLELAAHDQTVELRRLALRVGRGTLQAHGHVEVDGLSLTAIDLDAEVDQFPFDPTKAEAWINAGIVLHGHREGDRLVGSATLSKGKARLPGLETRRQLQPIGPLEDVVYVDEPASAQPDASARKPLPLPVQIVAHIPGPFHVDSPEMHAELRGELELRTSDDKLGIYGHAETTAGHFELLGREYEIERARASFDGDVDPVIDVRLTRAMPDSTVIISVHGTASAPQLDLTSDPPVYDPSQVLGLIVSGDPNNTRLDALGLDRQLVGAISGAVVDKIKAQILPGLPVDVIQVDTTGGEDTFGGLRSARIEVGKYIRHNIYVSYTHQLGTTVTDIHRSNAHEVNFEYRIKRHLVVGVRYGDAGIGAVDVAWTLRY